MLCTAVKSRLFASKKVPTIGSFQNESSNHWNFLKRAVCGLALLVFGLASSVQAGWYETMFLKGDLTSWDDGSLTQMTKDGTFILSVKNTKPTGDLYFRFKSNSDGFKDCGTHGGNRLLNLPGQCAEFYRDNTDSFYFSGTTNYYYTFTVNDPESTALNGYVRKQQTRLSPLLLPVMILQPPARAMLPFLLRFRRLQAANTSM